MSVNLNNDVEFLWMARQATGKMAAGARRKSTEPFCESCGIQAGLHPTKGMDGKPIKIKGEVQKSRTILIVADVKLLDGRVGGTCHVCNHCLPKLKALGALA